MGHAQLFHTLLRPGFVDINLGITIIGRFLLYELCMNEQTYKALSISKRLRLRTTILISWHGMSHMVCQKLDRMRSRTPAG